MLKDLLRRVAPGRVGDEDMPDEVLGTVGDVGPLSWGERKAAVADEREELALVILLGGKGWVPVISVRT